MNDKEEREETANSLLLEFYKDVDEVFLGYFISLRAPQALRQQLDQHDMEYIQLWMEELGLSVEEAEKRVEEADHMLGDDEFRVHTTTSNLRKILVPGVFEDLQAKNAIKLIYDSWNNKYRPQLEELIGQKIQGDIWGDLRYLRNSIAHRDSRGVDGIKKAKLMKNFAPGQKITLTQEIMSNIQLEIENWYTEFQLKYQTALKTEGVICRIDIPSGRARTFGLADLKRCIHLFGIRRQKKSEDRFD